MNDPLIASARRDGGEIEPEKSDTSSKRGLTQIRKELSEGEGAETSNNKNEEPSADEAGHSFVLHVNRKSLDASP